jgi:hypothetical protein
MNKYLFFLSILMSTNAQAQNVGIGTTTPTAKLDIINTSNSGYTLKIRPANGNGQVWMDSIGNIKMYDPANGIGIFLNDSSRLSIARSYNLPPNTTTKAMNVRANFINGGGSAIQAVVDGNGTGMSNSYFGAISGYNFINHYLANAVQGESTGAYGVLGTTFAAGKAGVYGYSFQGRGVEGYSYANTEPGGFFGGSKYALTTANGSVGIGTTTPNAKLELNSQNVAGDAFRLLNKAGRLSALIDSSGRLALGDLNSFSLYDDTSKLFINNSVNSSSNVTKSSITVFTNVFNGPANGIYSSISGNTSTYTVRAIEGFDGTASPFAIGTGVSGSSINGTGVAATSNIGTGITALSNSGIAASFATLNGPAALVAFGKVGIGTNAPQTLVHVHNQAAFGYNMQLTNLNTGTSNDDGFLVSMSSAGGVDFLQNENAGISFSSSGNTQRLAILSGGNVIIGSSSFTNEKLLVEGNLNVTGKIINEPWQIPSLNGGWSNLGSAFAGAGFYKDKEERVHLRGLLNTTNSIAGGSIIFVLPVGYRPSTSKTLTFSVSNNGPGLGRINIDENGNVVVVDGVTGWFSLCDISFRAD